MVTLGISILLVLCVIVVGRLVWHGLGRYGSHQRAIRTPSAPGQCELRRCTLPAAEGSSYCSPRHELDDEWNAAGY